MLTEIVTQSCTHNKYNFVESHNFYTINFRRLMNTAVIHYLYLLQI